MANALLDIPGTARKNEIITVKVVLSHIMETGYRRDISGRPIPRNIVRWFACTYGGAEIFRCEMTQAIAANPYLGFSTRAERSGPMVLIWQDDEGVNYREEVFIRVTD